MPSCCCILVRRPYPSLSPSPSAPANAVANANPNPNALTLAARSQLVDLPQATRELVAGIGVGTNVDALKSTRALELFPSEPLAFEVRLSYI